MGAGASATYASNEAAIEAGVPKEQVEKHDKIKATVDTYLAAFAAHDAAGVGALFASETALGNNTMGAPTVMPKEKLLGLLQAVMFDAFGFVPTMEVSAFPLLDLAVCDGTLKIDTSLAAWSEASGKPAPFPQKPVKDMFGGADVVPAQLTLQFDENTKVTSIYWHLGPGATPGASMNPAGWRSEFAAVGRLDSTDPSASAKLLADDARLQVAEEPQAHRMAVMGLPTASTAGMAPPPEDEAKRVRWVAWFATRAAYFEDHQSRESNKTFAAEFGKLCNGGMMAMAGSYRGMVWHLEKAGANVSGEVYTILVTAKAKDARAAKELIDYTKLHGSTQLAKEDGACRFTIVPPPSAAAAAGDMPPDGADDVTVMWLETWKDAAAWEAHKQTAHLADYKAKTAALLEGEPVVCEFATTAHLAKA